MVDELVLAKQILNTGIRHTSIDFTVTDEFDNLLMRATAKDVKTGKIFEVDDEGMIHIPKTLSRTFPFYNK